MVVISSRCETGAWIHKLWCSWSHKDKTLSNRLRQHLLSLPACLQDCSSWFSPCLSPLAEQLFLSCPLWLHVSASLERAWVPWIPFTTAVWKRADTTKCWPEKGNVGTRTLLVGMQNGITTLENRLAFPQRLKTELTYDSAIWLRSVCFRC